MARGLVGDSRSGQRVDVDIAAPAPPLSALVRNFWSSRWDLRNQPHHELRMLSDPCVSIVVEAGRSRVVGVWTRLFTRTLEGQGEIRAVKLKAGAARAFVVEPATWRDQILPLAVLGVDSAAVEAAVLGPTDVDEGFAALADVVAGCVIEHDDADVSLATALVDRIDGDRSIVNVDDLVRVAGLSLRPLQRLFRDCVGVAPKWVIRRVRLQEAAEQLKQRDVPLKELAAALGYADQAHFSRDFKAAVGVAPAAFVRQQRGPTP